MSLGSRLSSLLRTASRSPAVRRTARDLGRAAVRSVSEARSGRAAGSRDGREGTHGAGRTGDRKATAAEGRSRQAQHGGDESSRALADRLAGAPLAISYAPHRDEHPDPGEVVWGWVPYEEDLRRGKDRPVLVLAEEDARTGGRDGSGAVLVALMLTSRDRAVSGEVHVDEHGATWVDVGSGDWDRQGRPSEVRADRLLRLDPRSVRREGGRLPQDRFERVADVVREVHGWDG